MHMVLWPGLLWEAKAPGLMAGWACHCQYKASCSRHFISEDAQERQDKEVFQQNMKRRLESFKSTKHNICFTKSKPRPRKTSRKKACAFSGTSVWGWRLMAHSFELPSIGIQPRGTPSWLTLRVLVAAIVWVPFCIFLESQKGKVSPFEGDLHLALWSHPGRQQDLLPEVTQHEKGRFLRSGGGGAPGVPNSAQAEASRALAGA